MFEEVKNSLKKNLNDKLVSPFWGAFIISWCAWNWKVWYATFFVDASLLMQSKNILKVDYIISFYPWNYFYNIVYSLIPPLVASYIIVFWLPKLTKAYYARYLDFEYDNEILKEKKEQTFLKTKGSKLIEEENVLIREKAVEQIKEEKWDEEYEKFKKTKYFSSFNVIKQRIYESNGYIRSSNFSLPSDITAYYHANDIVEGISDSGDRIKITEKGKYFVKKYAEEN